MYPEANSLLMSLNQGKISKWFDIRTNGKPSRSIWSKVRMNGSILINQQKSHNFGN
jgi:ABC-type uncharacterized transport system permease subunit